MCFVLSCCTCLRYQVLPCYYNTTSMVLLGTKLAPSTRIRNHNTSHTPCAMDLNSTFAVDRATTLCFLLRHVTKLPPTNVQ
uniref:Uncharacterized protein n=1 Tax=Arundo donax TaxID=35708 RepID=A0A0A8XXG0_ARUDO